MAIKTDSQLLAEAAVITNETAAGANSANRVGTAISEVVENKINIDKVSTSISTDTGSTTKIPCVAAVESVTNTKQASLVSGTNIKTVNGTSLLGSGDLVVSSTTPSLQAVTIAGNTTTQNIAVNTDNGQVSVASVSGFGSASLIQNNGNGGGGIEIANTAGKNVHFSAANQTSPLGAGIPNVIQFPNETCVLKASKYKSYVCLLSCSGGSFTIVQLQNDFTGVTFTIDNPNTNLIRIVASTTAFTLNKTAFVPSLTTESSSGNPYFLTGNPFSTLQTTMWVRLVKYDGTGTGLTNFDNALIEVKVYN